MSQPASVLPYHYERLDADSAAFLLVEDERRYLHSVTTQIFESGPLMRDGRLDIAALDGEVAAVLPQLPRYRQKLKWIPFEEYPVWVDDRDFRLDFHLRHTGLPAPGGMEQLSRFVGRVMSQRLDRSRPLWECWVVEGLEGGRFALVSKVHHALLDEESPADLFEALLSVDPEHRAGPPMPWLPRPAPSRLELGREELFSRLRLPQRAGQRFWRFAAESGGVGTEVKRRARAVARLTGFTVRDKAASPFAATTGSHRRVEHLELPLDPALAVRRHYGVSLVDVLLALVAGAVRRYLQSRYTNPATLDMRIAVPIRVEGEEGEPQTAAWLLELPIWEPDPAARIEHVRGQLDDAAQGAARPGGHGDLRGRRLERLAAARHGGAAAGIPARRRPLPGLRTRRGRCRSTCAARPCTRAMGTRPCVRTAASPSAS